MADGQTESAAALAPAGIGRHYTLTLQQTQSGTGYFAAQPVPAPDLDTALDFLRAHPCDAFMHRYCLSILHTRRDDEVDQSWAATPPDDQLQRALLCEACLMRFEDHDALQSRETCDLADATPLLIIRSHLQADQELHWRWAKIFAANRYQHASLPAPAECGLPPLAQVTDDPQVPLSEIAPPRLAGARAPTAQDDAQALLSVATMRLERLGVLAGEEKRHLNALCLIGLLRPWHLNIQVDCGRHHYRLTGRQTAYGKGFHLDDARISCAMEIVERCSAFTSVVEDRLPLLKQEARLRYGTRDQLRQDGLAVLDPNDLGLEAPYRGQPLYWLPAAQPSETGEQTVYVPFQSVFLFANLDEIELFSGLGSTGLAAGTCMAQARSHALLELFERDAEAVQPFDPSCCFRLGAHSPPVAALLHDYRMRGIDVFFQDCSGGLGVPCYQCFVYGPDGTIARGSAAHLAGRRAALSALAETTYPYPSGPPSRPGPPGLPNRMLEELPDYASGDAQSDLRLLEQLLQANGRNPIYVDLTRRDLDLPVVKALVPGLNLMSDLDRLARIPARLFANYQNMFR